MFKVALKQKVSKVEKKPLQLVLPYLETESLETKTKSQESIKWALNSCKLQVIFKSHNKLCNNFGFKDSVPQILRSGVVYKFQLCNNFPFKDPVCQILHQVWFISFSEDYAMNVIRENVIEILL